MFYSLFQGYEHNLQAFCGAIAEKAEAASNSLPSGADHIGF